MTSNLFNSINQKEFLQFTKAQLIDFFEKQKEFSHTLENSYQKIHEDNNLLRIENEELKKYTKELEEKIVTIDNQLVILKSRLFKRKSEKSNVQVQPKLLDKPEKLRKKRRKKTILLPSERYPDAPIIERDIELKELPNCTACGSCMEDSGMTEDSEYVTVVPAQYLIIKQKRHKYRCGKCHGHIHTAPAPKRIIPGSSYGDDIVCDVALSKYCDLVPVERYSTIAGREGLKDLPPQSLIGLTHNLADFLQDAYVKIKEEVLSAPLLHADETPHRMLEGDTKSRWYLWGFSTLESSYFDIRDTRSGEIASELLTQASCKYLVSDVFSGYQKAINKTNELRTELKLPIIESVYCNAHARRKFKEASEIFPEEAKFFIEGYSKIYHLESEGQESIKLKRNNRKKMKPIFEEMKKVAEGMRSSYSSKSSLVTAIEYFLKNYIGFTRCLKSIDLPLDNNHQERQLRNPVIGRKTWYGTHSKRGAQTAAVMFSLVESCKLNKINPRLYFSKLINALHNNQKAFSPKEFKNKIAIDTG